MTSSRAEIVREISKLKEMEKILEDYIEDLRLDKSNIKDFMEQIALNSWQQGQAKQAFFNRFDSYHDVSSNQIHNLEDTLVDMIETRKLLTTYYLSMSMIR